MRGEGTEVHSLQIKSSLREPVPLPPIVSDCSVCHCMFLHHFLPFGAPLPNAPGTRMMAVIVIPSNFEHISYYLFTFLVNDFFCVQIHLRPFPLRDRSCLLPWQRDHIRDECAQISAAVRPRRKGMQLTLKGPPNLDEDVFTLAYQLANTFIESNYRQGITSLRDDPNSTKPAKKAKHWHQPNIVTSQLQQAMVLTAGGFRNNDL